MNRDRRKEAGKVFLDLSKYLITSIAISGVFVRESIDWRAIIISLILALVVFIIGFKLIPPDKEV